MDDNCELISWCDLDDWIRCVAADCIREQALPLSMAISFVGERPDLVVGMPAMVLEDGDEILDTLIDMFGAVRPERLAVVWPNYLEDDDTGEVFCAVRVNSAWQTGPSTWDWRTRVLACRWDEDTGEVTWYDPIELDGPVDPWSRRLRLVYDPATYERLAARGWIFVPGEEDGWFCGTHPDSRTLAAFTHISDAPPPGWGSHRQGRARRPARAARGGGNRRARRQSTARRPPRGLRPPGRQPRH